MAKPIVAGKLADIDEGQKREGGSDSEGNGAADEVDNEDNGDYNGWC